MVVGGGLTMLALAIALARGTAPGPAPVRAEPPRVSAETRARLPPPPPAPRAQKPLDPAAVHARMQVPRSADLRNPFELPAAHSIVPTPPRDLKDPFARRRQHGPMQVSVPMSPDLRNPFAAAKTVPEARRVERTPPPAPPPACATATGVPVQRPRALRPSAPPCPAPEPSAVPPRPE